MRVWANRLLIGSPARGGGSDDVVCFLPPALSLLLPRPSQHAWLPYPIPIPGARQGRRQELVLRYDSSHEPDFRGQLSIEVTGVSTTGKIEFCAHVGLSVNAGHDRHPAGTVACFPAIPTGRRR
jgi:hypothetical protein